MTRTHNRGPRARLRIGSNCELNICIFGIRRNRFEGACLENEGSCCRPNQSSSRVFSYTAFRFQLEFTSFNIITVIICEADQIVEANGYLCAVVRLAFAFCDSLDLVKIPIQRRKGEMICDEMIVWGTYISKYPTNIIAYTIYVYISRQ